MAYLQVETEDGVRRIVLDRGHFTIGRVPTNDIVITHQQVSRHHAELRAIDGAWWIADLESKNGIQVRGMRIQRHLLREGERIQLAPDIVLVLVAGDQPDDLSVQPTAYVPALASPVSGQAGMDAQRRVGAMGRAWLPPSSATAWGASARGAAESQRPGELPPAVEGDLFRRKRSRVTSAPTGDVAPFASRPTFGTSAAHLHLCQTCGQQTAPDSPQCQACGSSIALPCRACGLSLLPIQDLCPRCQTANPSSVLRTRQTPSSA